MNKLLAISFFAFCSLSVFAKEPTNIVFILADDLGWADLGCYGNTFNETPNLDRMAREGMRFTDAYAAAPVCSPTRASILTGQHPARLGITDWIPGHWYTSRKLSVPTNTQPYLPSEATTIAEALKPAGYTSAFFGKWHLGDQIPEPSPTIRGTYPDKQGFDEFVIAPHPYGGPNLKFFDFSTYPALDDEDAYLTDWLTDRSLRFIEEHKDQPFFLYLSHLAVHNPLVAKEDTLRKYQQKSKPEHGVNNPIYAAMLESMDEGVGRILDTLDKLGLSENTLVIFYSDNGGVQGYGNGRSINTSNAPLRDQKGTLYEGGIRVPLIARWTGTIEPSTTSGTPVSSPDFFPTFLRIAGEIQTNQFIIDGQSLLPTLMRQGETLARPLFWHYPHYHSSTPASVIRKGEWKLIEFFENNRLELYNLALDIGETTNLAATEPGIARLLRDQLHNWRESVEAMLPAENPNFNPTDQNAKAHHPHAPKK